MRSAPAAPPEFRSHLLDGGHWFIGRRIAAGVAEPAEVATFERIEAAIAAIAIDRPTDAEVLRHFLKPRERRPGPAATAKRLGVGAGHMYAIAGRAVALVWAELGEAW